MNPVPSLQPVNKWSVVRLDEACDVILGQSPPGESYNNQGTGLPFFQGKAEFGDLYPTPVKWCTKPGKIAQKDDVLISVRAPVGPTNLSPSEACIGRGLAALRPRNGILPRYILYAIRSTVRSLVEQATGSTFEAITGSQLRGHVIPLASASEQKRIVAEIEKQFTRLDAGVASLKRVQTALQRYRASVLKSACEGRLVPTEAELARKEKRTYETGEQLLRRIVKERREECSGKGPSAVSVDLPQLPDGWAGAIINQLAAAEPNSITDGPFGSNLKTEHYTKVGPRVIRLQNIGDGVFVDEKAHISEKHFNTLQKHRVFAGDLVIAALGENPPRSCVIPGSVGPAIVKADCIRFKPHRAVEARYLNFALNSDPVRKRTNKIVHGVGRPRLNLGEIKSILVPLPPLVEQQRIVADVEQRLSVIAEVEAIMATNLQRATRLRQCMLQRAFDGRISNTHAEHG